MTHQNHTASCTCPDCTFVPFTRNNYFTGKLMTSRDFFCDQEYFSGKLRHHNQRLHGSGVACGLEVVQHPNEQCRDHILIVRPGSAIDCCGREILVVEEEPVDLNQFKGFQTLAVNLDDKDHRLQLCIRYQECPTEEVPVLYDDCGCNETQCAPNRILESYAFDLLVDQALADPFVNIPQLERLATINPPHAWRVAIHGDRLYALGADASNNKTIFQIETGGYTVVGTHSLPARPTALAVSADGKLLYAVMDPPSGQVTDPLQLVVIDTANMSSAPVRSVNIQNSAGQQVDLGVAPLPDGRPFVLLQTSGELVSWPLSVNDPGPDPTSGSVDIGDSLASLAFASNASFAYSADAANNQLVILSIASNSAGTPLALFPAGATPNQVALVSSTGPDLLVVTSSADLGVYLVDPASSTLLGKAQISFPAVDLAVSPGGGWAYILEEDAGQSYVQVVSLTRLKEKRPALVSAAYPIGKGSGQVALSPAGSRLFVAYPGDMNQVGSGGVAVLKVTEENCADLLEGACPTCDTDDCVVLATIENYRPGFQLLDEPDPPADPDDDRAAQRTRIDLKLGRKTLPSVAALADAIRCLMDRESGGAGTQGPPGPMGPAGPAIDGVTIDWVPCGKDPDPPSIVTDANGQRILVLHIPDGCQDLSMANEDAPCGERGSIRIDTDPVSGKRTIVLRTPPALTDLGIEINPIGCQEKATGMVTQDQAGKCHLVLNIPTGCETVVFPRICAINWPHDGPILIGTDGDKHLINEGLVIAFDQPVLAETLTSETFQVLYEMPPNDNLPYITNCYCNVRGLVTGLKLSEDCAEGLKDVPSTKDDVNTGEVNAARFIPLDREGKPTRWIPGRYRVSLEGDQVLGSAAVTTPTQGNHNPGIDADHIAPGLAWPDWILAQQGPPPLVQTLGFRQKTGNGTEGGTFLSWFSYGQKLDINRVTRAELTALPGVGEELASAILTARDEQPFTKVDDLLRVSGIGKKMLHRLREYFTVSSSGGM